MLFLFKTIIYINCNYCYLLKLSIQKYLIYEYVLGISELFSILLFDCVYNKVNLCNMFTCSYFHNTRIRFKKYHSIYKILFL